MRRLRRVTAGTGASSAVLSRRGAAAGSTSTVSAPKPVVSSVRDVVSMLVNKTPTAHELPDGIPPSVWGPAEWVSMFALVLRLRDAEREAAAHARKRGGAALHTPTPSEVALGALRRTVTARIESTPDTLACQHVCAPHMRAYLVAHPLSAETLTSKALLQWLRGLRANVDARKGRTNAGQ